MQFHVIEHLQVNIYSSFVVLFHFELFNLNVGKLHANLFICWLQKIHTVLLEQTAKPPNCSQTNCLTKHEQKSTQMTCKQFLVFLKSERNGEQTQWRGASLAASAPCACVCKSARLIVCSNVATWQSCDMAEIYHGKKTKILNVVWASIYVRYVSNTQTKWNLRWKQETAQTAKKHMLFAHRHLWVLARSCLLVASEEAGGSPQGKNGHLHWFSFPRLPTECGGRDRPLPRCPPGDQMKALGFSIPS